MYDNIEMLKNSDGEVVLVYYSTIDADRTNKIKKLRFSNDQDGDVPVSSVYIRSEYGDWEKKMEKCHV